MTHPTRLPSLALLFVGAAFIHSTTFTLGDRLYSVLADDPSVSLDYARSLATTGTLLWTPGAEHVEGFSSLLSVLIFAVPHLLRVPEPLIALTIQVFGLLVLLALVHVAAALARRLQPESETATAWLVALSWPLIFWTLRGFEVGLAALIVTSLALVVTVQRDDARPPTHTPTYGEAWARRQREPRLILGAIVLLALGILCRDDLAIPLGIVCLFSPRRWTLLGALGSCVLAKLGWRWVTYHDFVPLTAHLKLGGVPLLTRLARGGVALGHAFILGGWLPALGCVAAWRTSRLPAAVLGSVALYDLWVGSDAWIQYQVPDRFLCVGLPLALVGAAMALTRISGADISAPSKL